VTRGEPELNAIEKLPVGAARGRLFVAASSRWQLL